MSSRQVKNWNILSGSSSSEVPLTHHSAVQFPLTGVTRRAKTAISRPRTGLTRMTGKSVWVLAVPLLLLLMVLPAFAVNPYAVATLNPHGGGKGIHNGTSTNWSGYAMSGANGSVTDVMGTWVVPGIQGSCPTTSSSSFWVGMDGLSSSTVEQVGTISACVNGSPSYSAWYEYYPKALVTISSLHVKPGDVISAQVSYSGGIVLSISDLTSGKSFSTVLAGTPARNSAEWVAEDPSNSHGILPFADFGVVSFGGSNATIAGVTGPIGAFGSAAEQIQMVSSSGAVMATPSQLSTSGSGFSVSWA